MLSECERVPEIKTAVCHTLQDTMNKLYAASSIADRGTMCQLKNDFNHRNVTTTVIKSFSYNDNFVRFTTEAHVVTNQSYYELFQCHHCLLSTR